MQTVGADTAEARLASRLTKPEGTVVSVGGAHFGGDDIVVVAGPCTVESPEQLLDTALAVRRCGASMLRGGAFKPRTSPYAFQGLREEGVKLLGEVGREVGLPVVTEVMDSTHVDIVAAHADMLQVGSRSMHQTTLLEAVGRSGKPVLLKRGMSATVEEWLLAAEYILAAGNERVVLCERGIRTFETATRNTLDLAAVAWVKARSHLPVIVDPSHGTGHWDMVSSMSRGSIAVGADGLLIEVHADPESALCDGPQSLRPEVFDKLMADIAPVAHAVGRHVSAMMSTHRW